MTEKRLLDLEEELDYYKTKCASLETGLISMERDKAKLEKENEQLKKDRFICLDCEHSGYTEIGCLCEYDDHWVGFMSECEDFKELRE